MVVLEDIGRQTLSYSVEGVVEAVLGEVVQLLGSDLVGAHPVEATAPCKLSARAFNKNKHNLNYTEVCYDSHKDLKEIVRICLILFDQPMVECDYRAIIIHKMQNYRGENQEL